MKKLLSPFKDPLFKSVMKFSTPVLIDQFCIFIVELVLVAFCKSAGPVATSAVGLSTAINNIALNMSTYMSIGGGVIAAQHLGREDVDGAKDSAKQALYSGLIIMLTYATILFIFRSPILSLVYGSAEADVFNEVVRYISIAAFSYPLTFYMYQGYAILRAGGDSKTPMFINVLSACVNVVVGFILIRGVGSFGGFGSLGSAITLLVTRCFTSVMVTRAIKNPEFKLNFSFSLKFKPHWGTLREIYAIALPGMLEGLFFSIGRLVSQAYTTLMSTVDIAANSIGNNVANLVCFPTTAYISATPPLIGKAIGEGSAKKAKKTANFAMLQCFLLTAVVCFFTVGCSKLIASFYTKDAATLLLSHNIMRVYAALVFIFYIPGFLLPAVFRGSGSAKVPMITANTDMIIRVIMGYFLAIKTPLGVWGIWIAMYFDWVVRLIVYGYHYLSGKWLKACGLYSQLKAEKQSQ